MKHVSLLAAVLAVVVVTVSGQERTGRFTQTVPFTLPKTVSLNAVVGPVKITTLDLTDLGRGYSAGNIAARMRGNSSASEVSTTVRSVLAVDNPTRDEWELTLTFEFLDKNGKVVDKLTKKNEYDDETAKWTIEHPLLEYVVPLITQIRVTIDGRIL